jgi:hypothetical protein
MYKPTKDNFKSIEDIIINYYNKEWWKRPVKDENNNIIPELYEYEKSDTREERLMKIYFNLLINYLTGNEGIDLTLFYSTVISLDDLGIHPIV